MKLIKIILYNIMNIDIIIGEYVYYSPILFYFICLKSKIEEK